MQAPRDNSRKRLLRQLTQILFLAGIIIVAIPFFSGGSEQLGRSIEPMDINVADMREGEFRSFTWNGWPVFILRRSAGMLATLRQPADDLLDPWSKRSEQPANAGNVYRSVKPAYFVSYLGCSAVKCPLQYQLPVQHGRGDKALLVCACGNSTYDLAGRVYNGSDDKLNLPVPEYSFPAKGQLRLLGTGREEK